MQPCRLFKAPLRARQRLIAPALIVTAVVLGGLPCSIASPLQEPSSDSISYPGEPTDWHGFRKFDFRIDDIPVSLVAPAEPAAGRPWVWHGEFFGHRPEPDILLLQAGFHCVDVDLPDQLGAPQAVAKWNRVYDELTKRFGLASKVGLVGLSRGGLYCYHWAIANPDRVACLYGDAPVVDFRSWPGGKGTGPGSAADWQRVLALWGFASDTDAINYPWIATEHLDGLARAGVPLLHVFGDADEVVPWEENTGVVAERYRDLGGSIELIRKPGVKHHPHGLEDPRPIVDFFLRFAVPARNAARINSERIVDSAVSQWVQTQELNVKVLEASESLQDLDHSLADPSVTSVLASWQLQSGYQKQATRLTLILPLEPFRADDRTSERSVMSPQAEARVPLMVLLPVEAQSESRWGNPVQVALAMKLAEKHRVAVVIPTFATLPWYADHPTDSQIAQESFVVDCLLEAIRWESDRVRLDRTGITLVGFSKSGWGATSLALRHTERFGNVIAFDAPLMMQNAGLYGSEQVFGSDQNFERYRLTTQIENRQASATPLRLIEISGLNFAREHNEFRQFAKEQAFSIDSIDLTEIPHVWDHRWIEAGLSALAKVPADQ